MTERLRARVLPWHEWHRLADTPSLGPIWRRLPVDDMTVVVVEDAAGAIIGHWTLFPCLHAEDAWVAPAHQKRGVVIGRLVEAMMRELRHRGVCGFITHAETPEVVRLLVHHLKATKLPGDAYGVPVSRS